MLATDENHQSWLQHPTRNFSTKVYRWQSVFNTFKLLYCVKFLYRGSQHWRCCIVVSSVGWRRGRTGLGIEHDTTQPLLRNVQRFKPQLDTLHLWAAFGGHANTLKTKPLPLPLDQLLPFCRPTLPTVPIGSYGQSETSTGIEYRHKTLLWLLLHCLKSSIPCATLV